MRRASNPRRKALRPDTPSADAQHQPMLAPVSRCTRARSRPSTSPIQRQEGQAPATTSPRRASQPTRVNRDVTTDSTTCGFLGKPALEYREASHRVGDKQLGALPKRLRGAPCLDARMIGRGLPLVSRHHVRLVGRAPIASPCQQLVKRHGTRNEVALDQITPKGLQPCALR